MTVLEALVHLQHAVMRHTLTFWMGHESNALKIFSRGGKISLREAYSVSRNASRRRKYGFDVSEARAAAHPGSLIGNVTGDSPSPSPPAFIHRSNRGKELSIRIARMWFHISEDERFSHTTPSRWYYKIGTMQIWTFTTVRLAHVRSLSCPPLHGGRLASS